MPHLDGKSSALDRLQRGEAVPAEELLPEVYDTLRGLARGQLRGARAGASLQPTALVHELFLRLVRADPADWSGREHFLAVAATAMRQIIADHARRRAAHKRGGGWERVTLEWVASTALSAMDVVAVDRALGALERSSARAARVLELRLFGGLTAEAVGRQLGVSLRTVQTDWRFARAFLHRALSTDGTDGPNGPDGPREAPEGPESVP